MARNKEDFDVAVCTVIMWMIWGHGFMEIHKWQSAVPHVSSVHLLACMFQGDDRLQHMPTCTV